jgi:hypothetical protein
MVAGPLSEKHIVLIGGGVIKQVPAQIAKMAFK